MNTAATANDFSERMVLHDVVANQLRSHFKDAGIAAAINVNHVITPERTAPSIDVTIASEDVDQMRARRRPAMNACPRIYQCNVRWEFEPIPV
jgi:hypothetical protein